MITLGLPMLYPQIAALKGTAKFQTLVVCNIESFLTGAYCPRLRSGRRSCRRSRS